VKKIIKIKAKNLGDLKIERDVLEAIHFHKAFILNEMRMLDKSDSGFLKKYAALNAFMKANVNPCLTSQSIIDLFNLYSHENSDSIEYVKVLNSLNADIANYLNFQDKMKETLTKYNNDNLYKYENNKVMRPNSSEPLTRSHGGIRNSNISENYLASVKDKPILERTIELEDVYKEIKAIKIIYNQIKAKQVNTYDQRISLTEFINVLREFSVVLPKEKVLKILAFIEIPNFQAFSLKDFENYLNKCKILSVELSSEEIVSDYKKLKDIIYKLGGCEYLFKSDKKSISKNTFINLLKNKENFTEDILDGIYLYIKKSDKDFTLEDYEIHFSPSFEKEREIRNSGNPKSHSFSKNNYNEEFEIYAIRLINEKLFKSKYTPDEYFDHFLNQKVNRSDNVLNKAEFHNAIKKEKFPLTEEEIDYLFVLFDKNFDNVIDRQEFIATLKKVYKAKFKLLDLIKRNNLDIEDLMFRMRIDMKKDVNKSYDYNSFLHKMRFLDHTLENEFIKSLFDELKTGESVLYSTLESELNVFKREHFRNTNNEVFTINFKSQIKNKCSYSELKNLFEKLDTLSNGLLSKLDFCKVIQKFTNDYKDEDIMKFLRFSKLFAQDKVNYPEFLDLIFYDSREDKFNFLVDEIKKFYLTDCNRDIDKLFAEILGKELKKTIGKVYIEDKNKTISLSEFWSFLKKKSLLNDEEIYKNILCKFDLDCDGKISKDDVKGILDRYSNTSYFKRENTDKKLEVNLFSSDAGELSLEKFKRIVKDIKAAIKRKNLTEIGLFQKLDSNNDGFVSHPEFNKNIDDIIKLAPALKDQFFNFLDARSLGLVDKDTFMKRFKEFDSDEIIVKNSWDVENLILLQVSKWIRNNPKLTDEEIFLILDSDCDGNVDLQEFKNFLLDRLNFSKNDFDDFKLERTISRISLTKNNNICQGDIKELVRMVRKEKNLNFNRNISDKFTKTNMKHDREDNWILEAIGRLGLFISENYPSLDAFFKENIGSNSENKMKVDDFMNFLKNHPKCFVSFKFTSDEIVTIYSALDSHKKSYVTLEDLKNKLFTSKFFSIMHENIKNFLKDNFLDGIEAFKYLKNMNDSVKINFSLTNKEMFDGIKNIFPNKYQTDSILNYISKTFKDVNSIPFSEFNYVYFDSIKSDVELQNKSLYSTERIKRSVIHRRTGSNRHSLTSRQGDNEKTLARSQSASFRISNTRSSSSKKLDTISHKKLQIATPFDSDPLEKIKRIIRASRFDYTAYFKMYEIMADKGKLNQFEFKSMLKKLNIGLTSNEIDEIHTKAGKERDGRINLKEFVAYITIE